MQLQKLTLMMTILLIMFLLLNWTCKKKGHLHIHSEGSGASYRSSGSGISIHWKKALSLNCQVSLVYFMCNLMSYALHPNRRDLKNYSQVLPCFRLLAMVPTFLLKSTGMDRLQARLSQSLMRVFKLSIALFKTLECSFQIQNFKMMN